MTKEIDDLAADLEPDQADLLFPPDELALPLPLDAREIYPIAPKGPGRPKGSPNKKNGEMSRLLLALGYRDPMHGLAALYSMTPVDLAMKITEWREDMRKQLEAKGLTLEANRIDHKPVDPLEAFQMQRDAMVSSLPYWHAKKSPEDAPPPSQVAHMTIGNLNVQVTQADGSMSAGIPVDEKIIDNQSLSQGDDVRPDPDKSHK